VLLLLRPLLALTAEHTVDALEADGGFA
jgi:hypothetical protein